MPCFLIARLHKTLPVVKPKCKYLVCNGIAPYFKEVLTKQLVELEHYVCLFDESFNHVIKKGPMEMHIRFWDTSMNIKTRYYNSKFMGKAAATDVLKTFKESVNGLDENKLLQVSMDGPNVNISFLSSLNED